MALFENFGDNLFLRCEVIIKTSGCEPNAFGDLSQSYCGIYALEARGRRRKLRFHNGLRCNSS